MRSHPLRTVQAVILMICLMYCPVRAESDYTVIKRSAVAGAGVAMVLCGGDNDSPAVENNLFRQPFGDTNILSLLDRADFVQSVVRDYTNETAIKKAAEAQQFVSEAAQEYPYVIVAAYSHGGQSVYFMDFEDVDHLVLIDGLMTILGTRASEASSLAVLWLKRFFSVAAQGADILVMFTNDREDSGASENGYALMEMLNKYAADPMHLTGDSGETVEKTGDFLYALKDGEGMTMGTLRLIVLEGSHGWACLSAADTLGILINTYKAFDHGEILYHQ